MAELAANAVTHGHVSGRDIELRLTCTQTTLHIEVTDTRTGAAPPDPEALHAAGAAAETGRGLLLVDYLAVRWGVEARTPAPGKTVWAELDLE